MIRATSVLKSNQSSTQTGPQSTPTVATQESGNTQNQAVPQQQAQPTPAQKVFYLMCGFCRWTTRDVKMPDATNSDYTYF